jgi:hypothetical protein
VPALFVVRQQETRSRQAAALAYLALLAIVVVAWAGADAIVTRFSAADWSEPQQPPGGSPPPFRSPARG